MACHVKTFIKIFIATMYNINTPFIGFINIKHEGIYRLKFFLAPSLSWGMAFKSRSQIFHTNVKVFVYKD